MRQPSHLSAINRLLYLTYLYPLSLASLVYPKNPTSHVLDNLPGGTVTLQLINTYPVSAITALWCALTTDFPYYEPHCKISPGTVCSHPLTPCHKASLCQIGYTVYDKETKLHDFVGLLADPKPVVEFCCFRCGVKKEKCKEQCSSYIQELVGYKVWEWLVTKKQYHHITIEADQFNSI